MNGKLIIAGAALALVLGACTARDEEVPQPDAPAPTTEKKETDVSAQQTAATYDLKIEGMMCTNCQASVTKMLNGMDGVKEAKVDWEAGKATVTMQPGKKFDEEAAHAIIDKDFKLVECIELTH